MVANAAPLRVNSGGFQHGTEVFKQIFFIIDFTVVKQLQSDFMIFFLYLPERAYMLSYHPSSFST